MSGRQLHRVWTFVLCAAMTVIGFALIVQGVTKSSGIETSRLLLGALFIAAGVARSYLELRRGGRS